MNVFRRLAALFTGGTPVEVSRSSSRTGRFGFRAYTPASEIDFAKYVGTLRDNAIVAALHAHISRSASQAKVVVVNSKGERRDDHPINELLRNPSTDHSWDAMLSAWLMDLMVGGNGYANMIPTKLANVPGAFQYLPMAYTSPISLDPTHVALTTHYEYRSPNGKKYQIPAVQVLHPKLGIDPQDQSRGISPLSSMIREVAGDNLVARFNAATLINFGTAAVSMTPEGDSWNLDPASWEDAVDQLTRQMTGDAAGGIIAPNFPAKIQNIGTSPDDMGIEVMGAIFVSRICAAFGADPMALGMASANKTYANLGEAIDATWHNCTLPLLMVIVKAIEKSVLHGAYGDYDLSLELDTSGVVALMDDTDQKTKTTGGAYQSGVITRAEARRALGYDATPDDEIYYHDAIMGEPKASDVAAVKKAARLAKDRRARMEDGTEDPDPEE
jgi:HK97 family phage portal protein